MCTLKKVEHEPCASSDNMVLSACCVLGRLSVLKRVARGLGSYCVYTFRLAGTLQPFELVMQECIPHEPQPRILLDMRSPSF